MRYLLFIACFLVVTIIIAYTLSETPHSFSETECRDCHIDHENDPSRLTAPMTKLCGKCHKRTIRTSSHPVDIIPQIAKIPADLPLRKGHITCNTCHNVHAEASLVFGIRSYFLRRPTVDMKFFCVSCHEENLAKPSHKELVTLAHMGGQYIVTDPASAIDPLSIECISCHDGSIGTNTDYEVVGAGVWKHAGPDTSHVIGVHYNTARMQGGGLTPINRIDRRIRFFAGKIGCGTCHDMYSTLPGRLVMPNDGSRLCVACHYDK